ncbi:hypothetical protein SDC9_133267 [bioreactor metagenome]|uniref:Uncharacterized protein n=1 Tax=bioreactor metagenome TaxID=1076179 RepID=A0A645DC83_9ZZZZ
MGLELRVQPVHRVDALARTLACVEEDVQRTGQAEVEAQLVFEFAGKGLRPGAENTPTLAIIAVAVADEQVVFERTADVGHADSLPT